MKGLGTRPGMHPCKAKYHPHAIPTNPCSKPVYENACRTRSARKVLRLVSLQPKAMYASKRRPRWHRDTMRGFCKGSERVL